MINSIYTNGYSIQAQRNVFNAHTKLVPAIEKIASGLRVNTAKDDAASLMIGSRMESAIRASTQVIQGINDGIGLLQTAQGGLKQVSSLLQKAREFAVQSMNGSISSADRATINNEYLKVLEEINRISDSTELYDIHPLKGLTTSSGLSSTPSIDSKYQNGVKVDNIDSGINPMAFIPEGATDITIEIDAYGIDDDIQLFTVDGKHLVGTPLSDKMWLENGVSSNTDVENKVFSTKNGFSPTASYDDSNLLSGTTSFTYPISTTPVNGLSGSYNGMNFVYSGDADWTDGSSNNGNVTTNPNDKLEQIYIDETTEPLMLMVVGSGSFGITVSWGSMPEGPIDKKSGERTGPFDVLVKNSPNSTSSEDIVRIEQTPSDTDTLGLSDTALDPFPEAAKAMRALDAAINTVSHYQSIHASIESNFDVAISDAVLNREVTHNARANIMDTDYAAETANMAAANLLQQVGWSVLHQANTQPDRIMKLLRWGGQ